MFNNAVVKGHWGHSPAFERGTLISPGSVCVCIVYVCVGGGRGRGGTDPAVY